MTVGGALKPACTDSGRGLAGVTGGFRPIAGAFSGSPRRRSRECLPTRESENSSPGVPVNFGRKGCASRGVGGPESLGVGGTVVAGLGRLGAAVGVLLIPIFSKRDRRVDTDF